MISIKSVIKEIESGNERLLVDPGIRDDLLNLMRELSRVDDDASIWMRHGEPGSMWTFSSGHIRSAFQDVIFAYEWYLETNTPVLHPSASRDVATITDAYEKAEDYDEDDEEEEAEEAEDYEKDEDYSSEEEEEYNEQVDQFFKRLSNIETSLKSFSSTLMVGLTVCVLITGIMNMGMLVAAGKVLQTCQG